MDTYIKTIINGLKTWVTSCLSRLESSVSGSLATMADKLTSLSSKVQQAQNTANQAKTTAGAKMAYLNPTGSGSFSMGRKQGSTVGNHSHAEGLETTASGNRSHAEGCGTTASGDNSHAEGTWNVIDTTGRLLHIVGNGLGETERSNAHTLSVDGIPWYQGRPHFGGSWGNGGAVGSQSVIANGDTEFILKSTSGKRFKITVSDDGTLTTTEVTT